MKVTKRERVKLANKKPTMYEGALEKRKPELRGRMHVRMCAQC